MLVTLAVLAVNSLAGNSAPNSASEEIGHSQSEEINAIRASNDLGGTAGPDSDRLDQADLDSRTSASYVSNETESSTWVSTDERVSKQEALPCTGPKDPINFEIFSVGSSISGLPLSGTARRCDPGAPADEAPANYVSYLYGHCEIAEGATGCALPLEIQTWPACQRSLAEYSFDGKPLPYRELPEASGAKVVEIGFALGHRVEIYTNSSTIVIFAADPALAREAVSLLRSQEIDTRPVTAGDTLEEEPLAQLKPPSEGATEGELSCQA